MSGNPSSPLQSERTEAGEQTLVSGVRPVTLSDQLTVMINQPLQPKFQSCGEAKQPGMKANGWCDCAVERPVLVFSQAFGDTP